MRSYWGWALVFFGLIFLSAVFQDLGHRVVFVAGLFLLFRGIYWIGDAKLTEYLEEERVLREAEWRRQEALRYES